MHQTTLLAAAGLLLLAALPATAAEPARPTFPPVDQLPSNPELPDPLVMLDGKRVTSVETVERHSAGPS